MARQPRTSDCHTEGPAMGNAAARSERLENHQKEEDQEPDSADKREFDWAGGLRTVARSPTGGLTSATSRAMCYGKVRAAMNTIRATRMAIAAEIPPLPQQWPANPPRQSPGPAAGRGTRRSSPGSRSEGASRGLLQRRPGAASTISRRKCRGRAERRRRCQTSTARWASCGLAGDQSTGGPNTTRKRRRR